MSSPALSSLDVEASSLERVARAMGHAARERVHERFLGPRSLLDYLRVLGSLLPGRR